MLKCMLRLKKKTRKKLYMKLNKIKFESVVQTKWINGCPLCGGKQWSYDEKLVVTPMNLGDDGGVVLGGKIIPLVAVACSNCGNTVFVNAKVIGALDGIDHMEGKNADK